MSEIREMIEVLPLKPIKHLKEMLTRCGIANKKSKILYPSCYVYENLEKFYIVHFKELFLLTRQNGYNNICPDDIERKNAIVGCMLDWGYITLPEYDTAAEAKESLGKTNQLLYVLSRKDKEDWDIRHKFYLKPIDILK